MPAQRMVALRDYPRGCGDDGQSPEAPGTLYGLPPRVRGRPGVSLIAKDPTRTTPAGAGTTITPASRKAVKKDYPRGCGDDASSASSAATWKGLPPRVRGRQDRKEHQNRPPGTTPAGAGTTLRPSPRSPANADYPRGCGDDPVPPPPAGRPRGLPPRVRGRRLREARVRGDEGTTPPRVRGRPRARSRSGRTSRTTPAGAGTTCTGQRRHTALADYPRGCGDDAARRATSRRSRGLPPRVRGRRSGWAELDSADWTTPAGAGTTRLRSRAAGGRRDYPRGCGDDAFAGYVAELTAGLPPRVRGRRYREWHVSRGGGTTPAGAGTTSRTTKWRAPPEDYPRGCGDDRQIQLFFKRIGDYPRGCGDDLLDLH